MSVFRGPPPPAQRKRWLSFWFPVQSDCKGVQTPCVCKKHPTLCSEKEEKGSWWNLEVFHGLMHGVLNNSILDQLPVGCGLCREEPSPREHLKLHCSKGVSNYEGFCFAFGANVLPCHASRPIHLFTTHTRSNRVRGRPGVAHLCRHCGIASKGSDSPPYTVMVSTSL